MFARRVGVAIACVFGAGYVPGAPGTVGSAVGAAIAWALYRMAGWPAVAVGTALLLPISIWAASEAEKHYSEHDSCHIVVDETVGNLIGLVVVPCDWFTCLVGFGFFRLFDSLKPFPARWIDRNMESALGVVLDDVAAGVQTALVMSALVYSGSLAWVMTTLHLV